MNHRLILTSASLLCAALAACSSGNDPGPADASASPDAGADAREPLVDSSVPVDAAPRADAAPATDAAPVTDSAAPDPGPTCVNGSALPPSDPHGPAATSTNAVVYAVSSWKLGDGPSGKEWTFLGFDIDGKETNALYDGCSPAGTGNKLRLVDGVCGIDNGFGENVVPLISALSANPSAGATASSAAGYSTMLVKITGLPSPLGSTSKVSAALYGAGALGAAAKFDGSDVWPVDEATVASGDVAKPLLTFDSGYVTGSTFVSGPSTGTTSIFVGLAGGTGIVVPLTHVVVQLDLSSDGSTVTHGVLSGIVPTETFVTDFQAVAGTISSSLCSGSAFDQIASSIRAGQDIVGDGTNPSGTPCGAISIGFGFTGHADKMGAATKIRPVDACAAPDAGTD